MTSFDLMTLGLIAFAYFTGSIVKGISGFGAIMIAVPLMSILVEPSTAIALTGISVLASNIWQLWDSKHALWVIKNYWRLLITLFPMSLLGAQFLANVDPKISGAVIGVIVILFCISQFLPSPPTLSSGQRKYLDPLVGAVAGLFGGATILTGSILILYLIASKLQKSQFVGAIAVMYLVNAIPIYITLSFFNVYNPEVMLVSLGLIIPAILGLIVGRKIRERLSLEVFKWIVTGILFLIGCLLIQKALV